MFRQAEWRLCASAAGFAGSRAGNSLEAAKPNSFTQPGLNGLRIAAYMNPKSKREALGGIGENAVAVGVVTAQLAESLFAVDFREDCPSALLVELGSRVSVAYELHQEDEVKCVVLSGLVIRVNPNGTYSVALDNHKIDFAVPREKIVSSEGTCKFTDDPRFEEVVEWIRSAGITSVADQQSTACVLFHEGWRADRLYLLESPDLRQLVHLTKSARMSIMEKAEWQRDHHRQMRSIYKERVKEKDRRYLFAKYAGILSASVAFCGAFSLFGWNYKNYLKMQRSYQMKLAVKTLCHPPQTDRKRGIGFGDASTVIRPREEKWIRQIFNQLDTAHPRIVVLTGYLGCGKSAVCRTAIAKENLKAVFVDVRNKEDTLKSVIKALGVPNVEACGDPLDFISDACYKATQALKGRTPMIVLKLREGDNLTRVYNEAVALACDRRMCHLVIEVPLESLTMANTSLPRLDFYTVPNFTPQQAVEYTQHTIDPVGLQHFIEVVGTNSNDLDELFAAVHQRRVSPAEYTNQKLLKAMRQLHVACTGNSAVKAAVQHLAEFPYSEGEHEGVDEMSCHNPALKDVLLYNPVQDVWLFSTQVLHTAARCLL